MSQETHCVYSGYSDVGYISGYLGKENYIRPREAIPNPYLILEESLIPNDETSNQQSTEKEECSGMEWWNNDGGSDEVYDPRDAFDIGCAQ